MNGTFLLVHSPLVGPSSWRPFADVATGVGCDVMCPDLTGVAQARSPRWKFFVDAVVDAAESRDDVIVVGHSGAGAMLPAVGARLGVRCRGLVFVDAVLPPTHGAHRTPDSMRGMLDQQTVDGVLNKWLDWWPRDVIEDLVPNADDRAALARDMPCLPRSFCDEDVPVPENWSTGRCAYLRLSAAYDDEFAIADQLGWPTVSIDGTHLSIHTDPEPVLDSLQTLVAQVR